MDQEAVLETIPESQRYQDSEYEMVTLKPIKKVYPGAKNMYAPFLSRQGILIHGSENKPEDIKKIEEERGIKVDMKFWRKFNVILTEVGGHFNPNNAYHKLQINLMEVHPAIATTASEINPAITEYVMHNEIEIAKVKTKKFKAKMKAAAAMSKMSLPQMRDSLIMMGVPCRNASEDVIYNKLVEKLESDPDKFNRMIEDPNMHLKTVLQDLIQEQKDVFKKGKNIYYGKPGDKESVFLGGSIDIAAENLKNKENEQIRIALEKLRKELGR